MAHTLSMHRSGGAESQHLGPENVGLLPSLEAQMGASTPSITAAAAAQDAPLPEISYTLDRKGCLTAWNRGLEALSGLSAVDLKGRPLIELFVDDDWPAVRKAIRKAYDGYGEGQARLVAKSGARRRYHVSGVCLQDPDLHVIGITGIARDLTAPEESGAPMDQVTTQVERQTQLLDAVLSASPDHIYMFDRGGRIIYVNQAAATALGQTTADIVGKTSREIGLPASITDAGMTTRQSVFASGSSVVGETRLRTVQGWRDFMYTLSPVLNTDGTVDAVVATASDITERKRAESKAELLREIAEHISAPEDMNEAFEQVLPRAAAALGCRGVVIYQVDSRSGQGRLLAAHGVPPALAPFAQALSFPPGEPLQGTLKRGDTLIINDMTQQDWLPAGLYERFGLRAIMAVPLRVQGQGLGALIAFQTRAGRGFDIPQAAMCRGIARQLAAAMEAVALQERLQDEADVSTALARVGRELIDPGGRRDLLHRLCELTTAELLCDFSHVWLWQDAEEAYFMAASHGDSVEHQEWLRCVQLTRADMAPVLAEAAPNGVVNVSIPSLSGQPLGELVAALGITVALIIELRRGEDVTGLYIAGYRGQAEIFSPKQERTARGIAQLGSLALESARLMEQLETANRLKSDFLATISHELRTPIHIIVGYHEMLLDGALGELSGDQLTTLRRTAASASELSDLITEILDVGRIEAGRMLLDLAETDLARLLREIDTEMHEAALQKPGVELTWHAEEAPRRITTDRCKLKVVLKNLVGNALKFTNAGSVAVRVATLADSLEVSVVDTGIGIAPEDLPRIFEAFRQVDSSTTRVHGGVGLGLHIARYFAQMLGGRISVESELGRGSTFRLWLPMLDAAGATLPGAAAPSLNSHATAVKAA